MRSFLCERLSSLTVIRLSSALLDDGRTGERAAGNEGGGEDDERDDDDDAGRQGATPVAIRRSTHAREC